MRLNRIWINGDSSQLYKGLIISELPPITKPLIRTTVEEVEGRDGDIVQVLGYSAYDKVAKIGVHGKYDIDEIIAFFQQDGEVIFSNEPDKYYNFKIIEQIDFERLGRFRTADVTFHCQPFKYDAVDRVYSENGRMIRPVPNIITKNGVTVHVENEKITVKGNSEGAEFFIPIAEMKAQGQYSFIARCTGTVQGYLRLINNIPSAEESFGKGYLTLKDGTSKITKTLTAEKSFNNLWLYVPEGEVDYTIYPNFQGNSTNQIEVFNRGNYFSRPIMRIGGTGDVNILINGERIFTVKFSGDQTVVLNPVEMNSYIDGKLANRQTEGDFDNIRLKPRKNVISWEGDVFSVSLEDFSRWI